MSSSKVKQKHSESSLSSSPKLCDYPLSIDTAKCSPTLLKNSVFQLLIARTHVRASSFFFSLSVECFVCVALVHARVFCSLSRIRTHWRRLIIFTSSYFFFFIFVFFFFALPDCFFFLLCFILFFFFSGSLLRVVLLFLSVVPTLSFRFSLLLSCTTHRLLLSRTQTARR